MLRMYNIFKNFSSLKGAIFFTSFLICNLSFSQVTANAEINRNEIRIGEPIELQLTLQFPDKIQKIKWPIFKDTITQKIEIIDASKIDTLSNNTLRQTLHISVYDSGQFVLPSIKFVDANDTTKFVQTNTLLITVHTVPTDTSELSIKDIKPIFEEPFDIKWYMPLIIKSLIALLILGIIIYLIYRYLNKKKKTDQQLKPKLPPHIVALEKLQKIKQDEIWKEGKIKEYYSAVADTIREYIEGRYQVPALEQTSFETLQSLRFKAIAPETREKLKYLLELADLVKFAKFLPIENDHYQILQSALDFVNETKLESTHINESVSTTNPS
ncbi:MAG: hypothetical protein KatS3mg027_0583 [Bacteroidia bacterium]|nr:MAG: hypothetical protein KatS3mg027_0583 [Bacteroidia bacterium]